MVKRFGEFHWTFCVLNRIGKEEGTMCSHPATQATSLDTGNHTENKQVAATGEEGRGVRQNR